MPNCSHATFAYKKVKLPEERHICATLTPSNMKLLVIFATALLCAQAIQLPYILHGSSESSEEQYRLILPAKGEPGYGVINQLGSSESSEEEYQILLPATGPHQPSLSGVPIFRAVEVKLPRYVNPLIKQQLFAQALAARGLSPQDFGTVPLTQISPNWTQRQVLLAQAQRQAAFNHAF